MFLGRGFVLCALSLPLVLLVKPLKYSIDCKEHPQSFEDIKY